MFWRTQPQNKPIATERNGYLSDAERLGQDEVLLESVGLEEVADQTTLGEWLRAQTPESVRGLCKLNSDFVKEVIAESKPARVRHGGELEIFFDDTEIEVYGKKVEGARRNYNGELALSWQALWAGPFLLDQELGDFATVAECQEELIGEHASFWSGSKSYFYADSGSSGGRLLRDTADAGFSGWSVSYNKWTGPLERITGGKSESDWSDPAERNGVSETYGWVMAYPRGDARSAVVCRLPLEKRRGDVLAIRVRGLREGSRAQTRREHRRGLLAAGRRPVDGPRKHP